MQEVARARAVGWRADLEPKGSAGDDVVPALSDALAEALKNRQNAVFSVVGPRRTGKKLAIRKSIQRYR